MKFTKPIITRSGIALTALVTLDRLYFDFTARTCMIQIRVHKDVDSEALPAVPDPPFSMRFVIDNGPPDAPTNLFDNQVIPALQGENLMQRIRVFLKNQLGAGDIVDIDTDE